jgi:hypothetical protein
MNLYPICDVQLGARGFAEREFQSHVMELKADPIGRAFGGGDFTDGISPSQRKVFARQKADGKLYDTTETLMRRGHALDIGKLEIMLRPIKDRFDFMLKGHHLLEYVVRQRDGTHIVRTSDHDIADFLGVPFFGEPGLDLPEVMVTYTFPPRVKGRQRPRLVMFAMHGSGGGGTAGAALNAIEKQMRGHEADIYFTAHHHKSSAARLSKLGEGKRERDALLVSGGSWMRSFLDGETTYAEDAGMLPLGIGAPIISVRVNRDETISTRAVI